MSSITACPQCQTRFRVTEEQLQIRNGNVRCGRCAHVFNALESLIEESPPLPEEILPAPVPAQPPGLAEQAQETFPAGHTPVTPEREALQQEAPPPEAVDAGEPLFDPEIIHPEIPPEAEEALFEFEITRPETPADAAQPAEFFPEAPSGEESGAIEPVTEQAFEALDKLLSPGFEPEPEPESKVEAESRVVRIQPPLTVIQAKVSPASPKYAPPPKPRRAWPWALASLLLLAGLLAQGIYSFRDTIAAHYPLTRPLLEQACDHLQCRVSLPRNPDLIGIESSELHADPARANIVVLTSILRNRAAHVQAYPTLELTLTNTRDEMVARKLFPPTEYLRNTSAISQGIPTSGEVAVKLLMDIGELKAEGYRLYLFYPPQP